MNIYQQKGFTSRRDYLKCIADDYGLDESTVFALASLLGANEDFDGLLSALDDASDLGL